MAEHKPEVLACEEVAKTKLFTVDALHLRYANGQECHFERLRGPTYGSVMLVPFLDDNTVLLVREYCAGVDEYVLALPKGGIHKGETAVQTANRELMEEVGYGANDLQHLGALSGMPAYSRAKMDIVLARDLYEKRLPGDEPEPIEVVPWQFDRLDELFAREDMHEARSIAALCLVERMLRG